MRLDDLPKSDRVEDRRGLPAGPAGIGIGTVVVLALIGWALGIDPSTLIGGAEQMLPGGSQTQQQQVPTGAPSDEMGRFVQPSSAAQRKFGQEFLLKPEKNIHRQHW